MEHPHVSWENSLFLWQFNQHNWEKQIFNGKTHYKWPFSIAILTSPEGSSLSWSSSILPHGHMKNPEVSICGQLESREHHHVGCAGEESGVDL